MAFGTLFTYAAVMDQYNQVVDERRYSEWEIQNERFKIIEAQRDEDGSLNATIKNYGTTMVHLTDLWVTVYNSTSNQKSQKLYEIDYNINTAELMYQIGNKSATELPSGITVNCINLTEGPVDSELSYIVKIVSARGNSAVYALLPPIETEEETGSDGEGQDVPMKITWNQPSFQYRVQNLDVWTPAWEIDRNFAGATHAVFRVNVTNLTEDNIELRQYSVMGAGLFGGEWSQESYYILGEGSTPMSPISFNSQTIPVGEWRYVYFGASIPEGTDLQPLTSPTNSLEVFVNIHFNNEGESVYYGITISLMSMYIYKSGC